MSDFRFWILEFGFWIRRLRFTFYVSGVRHHASRITHHAATGTQASRITRHASGIRPYVVFSITIALLLTLTAWWLFSTNDDGALAEIQRRGTLRVGLDASFPPFESINDKGEIVGLDVDIAQAIAEALGVEVELVNIGFDGLYDALLARRIDIILSGLPHDPRWTQDVAYTHNYFNAGQVLITRVDNKAVNAVEDLTGHTVAVEWGSQADMEGRRLAEEVSGIELLRYPTAAEAIQAVVTNEAETAVVDAVSGVSAFPSGLKIITYLTDEWYAAAVHIDSQALLEAVNQAMSELEADGVMAELQAKWLHGQ